MKHSSPFALLLLAAALPAQGTATPLALAATSSATVRASVPAAVFVGDADADGTYWLRGERYKLALATGGATFQPLFGPKAPRDFPLQLDLVGVAAGGVALPLGTAGAWQRHGDGFTRDRGGVQECWRAAPGHAQQYFVVPRPAAAGALLLRIAAGGELVAVDDSPAFGPGVRFVAPGLGDVRYSDAVVLDANGVRLDVPVVLDGTALTIHVPATFVAQAAWPIVVDPFVTTVSIDPTVSDVRDPKVACEPTTGNWLVVAEEHLSATDVDIVCKRYDNASSPTLLDTTYADLSTNFTHNPDVGFVAQPQQFLVAWHNATGIGNFQWRSRNAGSTTQGAVISSSAGIGGDLGNRPAIGSSLFGDRFLLVMFRKNSSGTDVFAVLYRNTGTNFGTLFVGPVVSPALGTVGPGGVSAIASVTDKWVVVWRECSTAACTQQTVRMQAIRTTGGVGPLVAEPVVDLATGGLEDEPSIAGHAGNLLAAWRCFDATTTSNDIHGVPIGNGGGTYAPLGPVQNLSAQEPNVLNVREQYQPSVSYDGCRFVYGYLEDDGNDNVLPHAATVFVAGATITWHEGHLPLSANEAITIDVAGNPANPGLHVAVWELGFPLAGDVEGAVIDARKPGVTSTIDQTGCGAPAEPGIALAGTPALGRTFTVSLSTPSGFPILLVGPQSINLLPGCGGCSSGIDLFAMQAFGVSSLAIAVPCDPALIQFRLAFQGLSLLQGGGCPASFVGFDFALSDTLTIQVL